MSLNYSGAFCELGYDELESVNGGLDPNDTYYAIYMAALVGGIGVFCTLVDNI